MNNLDYYVDVPIRNVWLDGSVHDETRGFFLSGCYIDPSLPGMLICGYASDSCHELQYKYQSAKSIDELKAMLQADGIFPRDRHVLMSNFRTTSISNNPDEAPAETE